ncbi:unnamed protein product [Lactuca virosa]|uniref:Uncharacterized protein n=1 Tax=Lactuca virosa TaxID=75947 RepID=A0AAU9PLR3_9ASTR|nr:unnamed protein product [Lactuca virosa]
MEGPAETHRPEGRTVASSGVLARIAGRRENTFVGFSEKTGGTIKEQLAAIAPALEQLWKQKKERIEEFSDVQTQIQKICGEIAGSSERATGNQGVDESDLSLKKLDEFHDQLQQLQKEKSDRLHKVLELVSSVHDLCAVLGIDFYSTVTEVHPSLNDATGVQSKSISNDTLTRLAKTVISLKEDKKQRLHKLQELATQLTDLWNLMDTSEEEQGLFDHVTCNMSASVDEVNVPGALALDLIQQAELEVERLDELKASKMKEIAFKGKGSLRRYLHVHILRLTERIIKAKEEALSRNFFLDKVEKWMSACEEESWLEDYNRDDNRYNASRGAHLNLKRAEKARILVNKIPGVVESLVGKTRAWEEEHGMSFMYDGVPLLAMLDEYAMLRHDREEEKRRVKKDQKKMVTEQRSVNRDGKVKPNSPSPLKDAVSRVSGTEPAPTTP